MPNSQATGAPPAAHSSKTLLRWKGTPAHLHGFRGRKTVGGRGLSLLFDPLVDAFLAAHFLRTGRLPEAGPTVLVLTDFYPLAAANDQGQDWAQQESANFLGGRVSGRHSTVTQLFDALFGKAEWKENLEVIAAGITASKVPRKNAGALAGLTGFLMALRYESHSNHTALNLSEFSSAGRNSNQSTAFSFLPFPPAGG